jgi:NADH:ubiquinone oxidoreductase subunit C
MNLAFKDSMQLAGKYLSYAQSLAESALLAPLRAKHKLNLNLPRLAEEAKNELVEQGVKINPTTLLNMADDLASREVTMLVDRIGIDYPRLNTRTNEYEEYIFPDPRKDFIR